MSLVKKLKYLLPVLFLLPFSSLINVSGDDAEEKRPVENAKVAISTGDSDKFVELYRNSKYVYSFKEELDVIQVHDAVTNELLWKTGMDVPYISKSDATKACKAKIEADPTAVCDPWENTTGNAIMNSLMTAWVYKNKEKEFLNVNPVSSAPEKSSIATSKLMKINNKNDHYRLDFQIKQHAKINISLHIYFDDKGIEFEIRDYEITGEDKKCLVDITIAPFIGATGGAVHPYIPNTVITEEKDEEGNVIGTSVKESGEYSLKVIEDKEMANGYIVVPDGSGSIIPFKNNNVALGTYQSYVYGQNYTNLSNHYSPESGGTIVPLKDASMPMFGVVHNKTDKNSQKAICAYATKGEQHMSINVSPDKADNDEYIYAYAKFRKNFAYTEYYSQDLSQQAPVLPKDLLDFDIGMRYDFLEGDDANYVGIAKNYRNYLINDEKQLTNKTFDADHITTRLDFIMADAEDSVLGTTNAVVTTANDVNEILNDSLDNGINNIVTSLLGWQDGGVTLGRPDEVDFSRNIGTAKQYRNLISNMKERGVDVSFSQDYYLINENQISLSGNATKHINGKYIEFRSFNHTFINEFNYARTDKAAKWVKNQYSELRDDTGVNTMTVSGISNHALSHYEGTREKAMSNIEGAFSYLNSKGSVNADQPSKYLWEYVDRYFNAPISDSQHLIEEEEMPLLQLVLKGCMELYAPYSNFSFYDQNSVLKMIDFNVYPSFVLSKESSHLLSYTNSANYYSTEYSLYKDMIKDIYTQVDSALGKVINANWNSRTKTDNGLIVNVYSNGKKIVINYSDSPLKYNGTVTVPAQGFEVL